MPSDFQVTGPYEKFVLFGTVHLITMALTILVPLGLAFLGRRSARADAIIRWGFVVLILGGWISWYALFIARGWLGIGNILPVNLCDWAMIALLIALIRKSPRAYELAYAWAIAGTVQGIVTPDVNYSFPEPQFIIFMLTHADIVAGVLYLTFGTRLRQTPDSIPRVIAWTLGYGVVAGLTDWILGTNYGFMRAKPTHATLYDLLSPWPYYLLEVVAIGIAAVFLLYLPFYLLDRFSRPDRPAAVTSPTS